MALTEAQRGALIKDIKNNVDYTYEGYDPEVQIIRYGEGYDKKHPYILLQFLPANRKLFDSVGQGIGEASDLGGYAEFGFCHVEDVIVRTYCHQNSYNGTIDGRILVDFLANKTMWYIWKYWYNLLMTYNANIDTSRSDPTIYDKSLYDRRFATKIYILEFEVFLLTQFRWNFIPDDGADEEILEGIGQIDKINNIELENISE